jgi:hypothetical protein
VVSFDVAFDNEEVKLGLYFTNSKEDLEKFLADNHSDYSMHEIRSALCNEVYIEERISQINSSNFVFVAYSHGNEDSLIVKQDSYVDLNKNSQLFVNSFFYSTACATGKKLGEDLIAKGCKAFIGYNQDIRVFLNEYQNIFINCDNQGIKMFILGMSIGEAFESMKNYYTQHIDRLNQLGDPIAASFLVASREALVFFGNRDLVIEDFSINN